MALGVEGWAALCAQSSVKQAAHPGGLRTQVHIAMLTSAWRDPSRISVRWSYWAIRQRRDGSLATGNEDSISMALPALPPTVLS